MTLLFVLITAANPIYKITTLMTFLISVRGRPILIVQLLYVLFLSLVNSFFNCPAISVPNDEGRYFDGAALAIVLHAGAHPVVSVDNQRHDTAKSLDILYFFDDMAVTAVDHDEEHVSVEAAFLQMVVIEVGLLELVAAVLILNRVVHSPAEHPMLVVIPEVCKF